MFRPACCCSWAFGRRARPLLTASPRATNAPRTYGRGTRHLVWVSAVAAGGESVSKLLRQGSTSHVGWGIAAAAVGIVGNQLIARYQLLVGRRIQSATMVADAKHSWLDAQSSAGALVGLVGVAFGWAWADAAAGVVVTGFICHFGWRITADIMHRLLDGVDPEIITAAKTVAVDVPEVAHAHARAPWTGRTLRIEVVGFVNADTSVGEADRIGRDVGIAVASSVPQMRSFVWPARSMT